VGAERTDDGGRVQDDRLVELHLWFERRQRFFGGGSGW
jgi:hypothetical protein